MTEWIVTSCVLIAIVTGIRFLLKDRISAGLRYSLWLLVLLRLLLPVSLPSHISVMNLLPETRSAPLTVGYVDYELPDISVEEPNPGLPQDLWQAQYENNLLEYEQQIQQVKEETGTPVTLGQVLTALWIAGMAVTGFVLVFANCRFALHLKRSRRELEQCDSVLPVYITQCIETPCLFGIFRPAIYLTPELTDGQTLRHVLYHELTHRRHWDHIWSALRCVCLALHWYNPLVWVAANLSKQDAELACDEAVIRCLGEDHRTAYGQTLISMTCTQRGRKGLLVAATTMVSGKKALKERILRIAKHPKTALYALISVLLVAVVAVGCTFTGAQTPSAPDPQDKIAATQVFDEATYRYEGEGFGGDFFISLKKDGTFQYSEGSLSSYYGIGTWTAEGDIITLSDAPDVCLPFSNRFRVEKDALVWLAEGSTGYMYSKLTDGAKFRLQGDAPIDGFPSDIVQDMPQGDIWQDAFVDIGGVGYAYSNTHTGALPEGFAYSGTVYRDITGVPDGDYAASGMPGGARVYTSQQNKDTVYICEPENYGSQWTLKMTRVAEDHILSSVPQKELAQLQTVLSQNGYLQGLNVTFSGIHDLDLGKLFSFGLPVESQPLSQQEYDYVASQWGALAQDVHPEEILRLPKKELEAYLNRYFGCSLSSFSQEQLEKYLPTKYSEDPNTYYLYNAKQKLQPIEVTSAVRSDGMLYVCYRRQNQAYVASLRELDGQYVFLRNLSMG